MPCDDRSNAPAKCVVGVGAGFPTASCAQIRALRSALANRAPNRKRTDRIEIGDGCKIRRFNHVYATARVELGPKVLSANGVYISGNLHGYVDPDVAVMDQPLVQKAQTVFDLPLARPSEE